MARDAQLAGDRVQTEYYLQYADHYFRVLSENRARFEDQRRQRDEESDEHEGEEELAEAGSEEASEEREPRRERFNRDRDRDRGRDRDRDRPRRFEREERALEETDEGERSARMNGRDDSLPLDVLPPAIGADTVASFVPEDDEPAPAPRKPTRAPRRASNGDDEVAPAA